VSSRRCAPFSQTVAGETAFGIVFATEAERNECLVLLLAGGRESASLSQPIGSGSSISAATPPALAEEESRRPGRPSHDNMIAAALEQLGRRLDRRRPLAAQRRVVLRYLAQPGRCAAASIPGKRTVEQYLRQHPPVRKNSRRKPRKKSPVLYRASVRRT
jgi:hypothetical protein